MADKYEDVKGVEAVLFFSEFISSKLDMRWGGLVEGVTHVVSW